MPQFSYFQQIVNRTQIQGDRPVDDLPILNPTRPLFRQWEVHQPLAVENVVSRAEEPSLPPTLESTGRSTGLSNQGPITPVKTASSRRPKESLDQLGQPLADPLAVSPTPTSTLSPSEHSEVEPRRQDADEMAPPSTLQGSPAISPLKSPPAELPFRPTPSSAAPTDPPSPNTLQAIPIEVLSSVQRQSNTPLVPESGKEKSKPIAVEATSAPSMMQDSSGRDESLKRQQDKLLQPKDALSQQGDRSSMLPRGFIPSEPLPDQRSQQGSVTPSPKSATFPLQTTLEPPPAESSFRKPDVLDIPHPWVEPRNVSSTRQANTVHIGSIDVHIMPPPLPPVQPTTPTPAVKSSPSPLSRGFTSSFGLRQG